MICLQKGKGVIKLTEKEENDTCIAISYNPSELHRHCYENERNEHNG